jgi:hypothetical protein
MKIKCLATFSAVSEGKFYNPQPGDIIEVTDTFAKSLINAGMAVEIEEPTVTTDGKRVVKGRLPKIEPVIETVEVVTETPSDVVVGITEGNPIVDFVGYVDGSAGLPDKPTLQEAQVITDGISTK